MAEQVGIIGLPLCVACCFSAAGCLTKVCFCLDWPFSLDVGISSSLSLSAIAAMLGFAAVLALEWNAGVCFF